MKRKEFWRNKAGYYFTYLLILLIFVHVQVTFLAKFSSPFFHLDIVSILVIYICMRHAFFQSLVETLLVALLMQNNTSAPFNFFLMYFFLVFIFANIFSRIFNTHKNIEKLFVFFVLYSFKFIILYLTLFHNKAATFLELLSASWKEILPTTVIFLPLFLLLINIDAYFKLENKNV